MSAKLRAAQVLSLLLLARADFGGYSSAGSLNGVAIVAPNEWATAVYAGSNVATAYVSNGTGNWYYPQYASPYLNGASKGQGDVTYPSVNTDYAAVAAYTGTFYNLDIYWKQDSTTSTTPSGINIGKVGVPDAPSVAAVTAGTPGTYYSAAAGVGITKVAFASKKTGIAVGLGPSVAAGATSQPTILITKDSGASWQQVSGVPSYVLADAQTEYAAGPPTLYPMPPTGAPDLFGVYFASKSLGWAVGGNPANVQFSNGQPIGSLSPTGLPPSPAAVNSGLDWGFAAAPDWGYGSAGVLMTTNGGTVWRNVPVVYDQVSLYAAFSTDDGVGQSILGALQPGTLFAVHADSSGKNVWAVGANPWQLQAVGTGSLSRPATLDTYGTALATHTVSLMEYGTILYSANGGVSWTLQNAPAMLGTYNYALLDVYVAKSTTVFAVGGSLTNPTGAGMLLSSTPAYTQYTGPQFGNGIIISTIDSGNTWFMQSFPRNEYGMAPAFTCITFNGPVGWVGGYVFDAGAVVVYNSATSTAATYDLTGQWYTGVGGQGATTFTGTVTYPVSGSDVDMGLIATQGLSYTVLITMDRKMWTVVPPHAFPVGFALAGDFAEDAGMIPAEAVALQPDVKGIVWDNSNSGWMYGIGTGDSGTSGFILRTRNGGATWTYETPADVVANAMHVLSLANVPTSY